MILMILYQILFGVYEGFIRYSYFYLVILESDNKEVSTMSFIDSGAAACSHNHRRIQSYQIVLKFSVAFDVTHTLVMPLQQQHP